MTSFRGLGILVDDSLKFHLHIKEVFCKASGVAITILWGTLNRTPAFMSQIFTAYIHPIIDFGSVIWNTSYIGDLHLLESVQRQWTKKKKLTVLLICLMPRDCRSLICSLLRVCFFMLI